MVEGMTKYPSASPCMSAEAPRRLAPWSEKLASPRQCRPGTVVWVGFTEAVQAGNGGLEVVVYPESAHGVVDGGEDLHGGLVGVVSGDLLVHLEEVAVAGADNVLAEAGDGVFEVEVNAESGRGDTTAVVANFLGGT